MKRLGLLLLSGFALFTMVACGSSNASNTQSTTTNRTSQTSSSQSATPDTEESTTTSSSSDEEGVVTADFQRIIPGEIDVRNHFEEKDDRVLLMKTVTTIKYSALKVADAEGAKQQMEKQGASEWDGIKGIDHQIDYQEDRLVETTTVDLTVVDLEKYGSLLNLQSTSGDTPNYVSYVQTVREQEAIGLTKVENGQFQELE